MIAEVWRLQLPFVRNNVLFEWDIINFQTVVLVSSSGHHFDPAAL